jgi:hypothetical protein
VETVYACMMTDDRVERAALLRHSIAADIPG